MVERYSPYSMSPTTFEPTKTGAWVRYSDHEALERRAEMLEKSAGFATDDVARLETENATLRARVEELEREVERAFRDGIAYATVCDVTDVDLAWRSSAALDRLTNIKGESDG